MRNTKLVTKAMLALMMGVVVALGYGGLCSKSSSSGSSGTPHVKSWGTAALIETDDTGSASSPAIAFDSSGNAVAVWSQSNGITNNIWANCYVAGTGWATAGLIETNDTGNANNPAIAFDSSGNAIAVWEQSNGITNNIWANCYVAGTGWGTAALIETDDTGSASSPQIAVDSTGNAVAVWKQSNGITNNIWANCYVAGTGWATAGLIETNDTGNANYPAIACDSSGNAVAVWSQSEGIGQNNIWANRYVTGTGWGAAGPIWAVSSNDAYSPQIACDSSGNAIAVWSQYNARYNIWANRYVVGTGWGTAALIETDDIDNADEPQVAIDPFGNAIAFWEQSDGTRYHIMANRYVAGTGWGTAALIETDNSGNAYASAIACDSSGNASAVWQQYDGARWNIWANRYVVGTGWGTAALIETDDTGSAQSPQIACDSGGNAVAVWPQYDGTRNNIWANRFE